MGGHCRAASSKACKCTENSQFPHRSGKGRGGEAGQVGRMGWGQLLEQLRGLLSDQGEPVTSLIRERPSGGGRRRRRALTGTVGCQERAV